MCYLFNNLSDVKWKGWTLAVFAVSLKDAREYIRIYHGSGKYIGNVKSGKVEANCGAVTSKAEQLQYWRDN